MNLFGIFALALVAAVPLWAAISDTQLADAVRAAYPARLARVADEHRQFGGALPERRSAFVVLERAGDAATVFAVHSDRVAGAAQILTVTHDGFKVVGEWPELFGTGTGTPRAELLDVDGDARPELWAVFPDHRLSELTYVFRRTAEGLTLLSPTVCRLANEYVETDLLYPETVDLDGDKVLELVDRRADRIDELSSPEGEALILRAAILKLISGRYRVMTEAVFFDRFARGTGEPETVTREFYAPAGPAELVVINGADGVDRVASAEVALDGTVVISPSDLNQKVSTFKVPVTLKQEGVLTARLTGKPNAAILIYVTPKSQTNTACN